METGNKDDILHLQVPENEPSPKKLVFDLTKKAYQKADAMDSNQIIIFAMSHSNRL